MDLGFFSWAMGSGLREMSTILSRIGCDDHMGVSYIGGTPIAGWFIRENPVNK